MAKNKTRRDNINLGAGCLGMVAMIVVTALLAFGVLFTTGFDFDDSGAFGPILILCGVVGAVAFFWFGRRGPLSSPTVPEQTDSSPGTGNGYEDTGPRT